MTVDLASIFAGLGDLSEFARVMRAQSLMQNAGTCARPIRLVGGRDVIEAATGLLLDSTTDRAITVCCGNRRASRCSYCSTLYKYDAYNLVAAGLRGGKHVPADVAVHPRLFVTVTAPSFGPVHRGPDKTGRLQPCRPRRDGSGCFRWHPAEDPLIGTPLNSSTYDYQGHVLFNALAGKLWSETVTEIRRTLARLLGLSRRACERLVRVNFAKVAEYQARGIIHFHAVARLDGPDGAGSHPPTWVTPELLEQAIRDAVARTVLEVPESRALGAPVVGWGQQIDVRAITSADFDDTADLTDTKVARYIAKYATKSAESAGVELPPLACRACDGTGRAGNLLPCRACQGIGRTVDLDQWEITDHARRLIETCWRLGAVPELAPLRLRQWAHMLGFGGHFATKSRAYSTTFGALRQERADYTAAFDPELTALAESPDLIVINHWAFAGSAGHSGPSARRSVHSPNPDLEGGSEWTSC